MEDKTTTIYKNAILNKATDVLPLNEKVTASTY